MAELLLSRGADVSVVDHVGKTLVHLAVEAASPTLVEMFIEKGVDVNVREDNQQTALFPIVYGVLGRARQFSWTFPWAFEAELERLFRKQSSASAALRGMMQLLPFAPSLSEATPSTILEISKLLLSHGVDLSLPDSSGRTASRIASDSWRLLEPRLGAEAEGMRRLLRVPKPPRGEGRPTRSISTQSIFQNLDRNMSFLFGYTGPRADAIEGPRGFPYDSSSEDSEEEADLSEYSRESGESGESGSDSEEEERDEEGEGGDFESEGEEEEDEEESEEGEEEESESGGLEDTGWVYRDPNDEHWAALWVPDL
uniref:Uncharacterized protein n=1 Tax=Chromera velia CCMP2878 TaxID=1169474 RepID=A0A0G4I5W7_9ALVE|eukprot:Cvel_11244.t1-p1 / transcript=Cvel_11244.t1 / gene=Cvel_11244 / organism=Chromera_velia_CCMP2878 / gene_product=hypothetical protein / transcript_product=hypothetical protein / location=Cvel_scaffold700:55612-56544(+) / protein_length=311 / sequence_SO=supercontig / SO=protein_coding / is_pseudo=false